MYAACSLRSHREARTEPASAPARMVLYLNPRLADRLSVCIDSRIVERLADGIPGVKHGVAAFVIQVLECCFLTRMLLVVAIR